MSKKVIIIGSGLGGMSAACYLARDGYSVKILEKNETYGGRVSIQNIAGFRFDLGPSFYWMPSIFESFFSDFGKSSKDYYKLVRLDPSYRIFMNNSNTEYLDIPANIDELYKIFENLENGSSIKLKKLISEGKFMLEIALDKFLYRDYKSILDLIDKDLIVKGLKLQVYKSLQTIISKNFKNEDVRKLVTWQSLFLGASPKNLPALYIFMLYVDFVLGTWYPKGGIGELSKALYTLAIELGVTFEFNTEVRHIETKDSFAKEVITDKENFKSDFIVANADYHFVETKLLNLEDASYTEKYWQKRTVAPSSILIYLGINKKLSNLSHHNYYFSNTWENHFDSLFNNPRWPEDPSIYFSMTSKTDRSTALFGMENIFALIPVASNLNDDDSIRDFYFNYAIDKLEEISGEKIRDFIVYKNIRTHRDQIKIYNSFQGTCFGLAQTLFQTANFRPKNRSKKIKNLFYSGHFTHPGIGMPMVIISGKVVANLIKKQNIK